MISEALKDHKFIPNYGVILITLIPYLRSTERSGWNSPHQTMRTFCSD